MSDSKGRDYHHFLAEFMSWAPNFAILSHIRWLGILNLLPLQAEITQLKEDLADWVYLEESLGDTKRMQASYDWTALKALGQNNER